MTLMADEPAHPLRFAVNLWRRAMAQAWGALGLYAAIYAAGLVLHLPPPALLLLAVAELFVSAVVHGALMRIGLGDGAGLGPAGLQWTRVETRILLARLLLGLVLILLLVGAIFLMMLAGAVVMAAIGQKPATDFFVTQAGAAVILAGLASGVASVWTMTRLAMSGPATVDRGEVQVFATWRMTAGLRPWRLLFWSPLFGVAAFALGFLLRTTERTGGLDGSTALVASLAYALVFAFIETPIVAGVSVYAYLRLRP